MEIKRFRADWRHVVETEFDDAQYVGVKDFDRILAERDALQQRLNAVEGENDRLRRLTVDLRNCNFQGYNPDGSEPIVFAERPDGLKEVVGIKMDGWHCEGPRKENRS